MCFYQNSQKTVNEASGSLYLSCPEMSYLKPTGTYFVAGEREMLRTMQRWKDASKLQKEIKWECNRPAASHMGRIWERQIPTVRRLLNVILKEQFVNDDERLSTLFCKVESIVNRRPLITAVSDDPKDEENEGPLTPNHLLLLCGGHDLPPGVFDQSDIYGKCWRHVQFLSDYFWKRWLRQHLPILQLRQKWLHPKRNLRNGVVVLYRG